MRGRILDFQPRFFQTGVEIVKWNQGGNGDAETERRGYQRLRHAAGDGNRRVQFAAGQSERVNHAGDGAEQAEQRRESDNRVENREAAIEPLQFAVRRPEQRIGKRLLAMFQGINQRARHKIGAGMSRFNCHLQVIALICVRKSVP